jgi:GTP-binding protein
MLAGQQGLARVSPTPGFTKLINIFTMNKTWRLVDLPGYGFAHVAREDSAQFNHAVNEYLQHRKNLCLVFALIDSSLPPQAIDIEFVEWLTGNSLPFVLVFTKTDTVTPAKVQSNIAAFTDRISGWFEKLPEILTCSATARHGRSELLDVIEKSLAENPIEASAEPIEPPKAVELPEDLPAPGWPVRATATRKKRFNRARPW